MRPGAVVTAKSDAMDVVAYRGDAKTLLAFDLTKRHATQFAGFTIEVRPGDRPAYFILNSLRFEHPERHAQDPVESPNSSLNAPIHKFRWVHVPGSTHQGLQPYYGRYAYVVTSRYFDPSGALLPLDASKSARVEIEVAPLDAGPLKLGFTRGFVQSQAFVGRFGPKADLRPDDQELLFDTSQVVGSSARGDQYTYADEYEWSGFTARSMIFAMLDEVRADHTLSLDVLAYDLSEPDFARALIALAGEGRVRVILDNAGLHHSKTDWRPEDEFERLFLAAAKAPAEIKRGKVKRYSHDKVLVVRGNDGLARKVLTGSTNFSVSGLYVNSNHVLVLDDREAAGVYADVFQTLWDGGVKRAAFVGTALEVAPTEVARLGEPPEDLVLDPPMTITFAPHTEEVATKILGDLAARIAKEATRRKGQGNVLFAVMSIDQKGKSPVWEELRDLHADDRTFSFGISDSPDGISLYEPRRKTGVLVTGKPARTQLPAPFNQVPSIGSYHQIHHKFVVCGFNGPAPVVYCGSSNLALGGEQDNGDNLIEIHDADVVTAFAIEALSLVDHFQFLARVGAPADSSPIASRSTAAERAGWWLSTTDAWTRKYFDPDDLHYVDRRLFARAG